jgi:hypothetical protein
VACLEGSDGRRSILVRAKASRFQQTSPDDDSRMKSYRDDLAPLFGGVDWEFWTLPLSRRFQVW